MEIYVDADACPVKEEVLRVAERIGAKIFMVSNSWMRLATSPLIERVVVPEGPDAADDWIAERIGAGDIAVTADIPLAHRCLERGAAVLAPNGKVFSIDNIGNAMAMRELFSHLRDTGEVSGHNPAFSRQDRSNFLQALDRLVQVSR